MNSNFFTAIHKNLTEQQDKVFLRWHHNGKKVAYRGQDIYHRVALIWQNLDKNEIEQGDRIFLAMPFSPELVCNLLGVMSYGAVPVLPPPLAKRKDILDLVEVAEIEAVMFQKSGLLKSLFTKLTHLKDVTTDLSDYRIHQYIPRMVEGEDPAMIQYSPGSTNNPRAVAITHNYLNEKHKTLSANGGTAQNDLPLFSNKVIHNMAAGITTHIPDIPDLDMSRLEPENIYWQIEEEKIDSISGSVFFFRELLNYMHMHKMLLPQVKDLAITGSPVPESMAHQLKVFFPKAKVRIIYSSSHADPIAERTVEDQKDPALGYYVGKLYPGVEVKVNASENIKTGDKTHSSGRIQVKGRHIVQDKTVKEELEWLDTDDFGYLDEQKGLYLTGRQGNEAVIQGYSHYQVENVISSLPQVQQVAAIGDKNRNSFEVFFIGSIEPEKIREILNKFPDSLISSIQPVEKIPTDERYRSKILYHKVKPRLPRA